MKKILLLILVLLTLSFSSFTVSAQEPTPSPTPEKEEITYDFASMSTYEMFWPLVAGKVPGDRFYQLKVWRDKLTSYLFFSKLKKSEYMKRTANKRLIEAEKLLDLERDSYLPETLQQVSGNLEKGLAFLSSYELTPEVFWLRNEYEKDLQKHLVVLGRMKEKASVESLVVIEQTLEKIEALVIEYQLKANL